VETPLYSLELTVSSYNKPDFYNALEIYIPKFIEGMYSKLE